MDSLYIRPTPSLTRVILPPLALSLFCLLVVHFSNFLVFHTFAELFSVLIAFTTLTVALTTSQFTKNQFVVFLAIAAGWCSALDLIHLLSYKGLSLFPIQDSNKSSQLWIAARLLQAFAFVLSPFFLRHQLKLIPINCLFGFYTVVAILIIYTGYFPNTFIEGKGLTLFKSVAEWFVILLLFITLGLYWRERQMMSNYLFLFLVLSLSTMILSELLFSHYQNLYGIENVLGHLLKIFTYWFIYLALVVTTLREPFNALARSASTYDSIHDPTLIIQKNGIIVQANKAAATTSHLSTEALVGQSSHNIFHNPATNMEKCPVCTHLSREQYPTRIELQIASNHWIECSLSPIKSEYYPDTWLQVIDNVSVRKGLEIEKELILLNLSKQIRILHCLYSIANINVSQEKSIPLLLQGTVDALVLAYRHPEKILVCIESNWGEFCSSPNNAHFPLKIEKEIIVNHQYKGRIRLFYLSEEQAIGEDFDKEADLLDTVITLIVDAISRVLALAKAKQLNYLYKMLSSTNRAALRCNNKEELFAALFSALANQSTFSTIFIATVSDGEPPFSVNYSRGLSQKSLNYLITALNSQEETKGVISNQFTKDEVIKACLVSMEKNKALGDQYLQDQEIREGFLIPLMAGEKIEAVLGLYGRENNLAGEEQKKLLNQIAQDMSLALTGFTINEQRLSAEEKAKSSEQNFTDIFKATPLPMLIVSIKNNAILDINKAFEKWLGYSLRDLSKTKSWVTRLFGHSEQNVSLVANHETSATLKPLTILDHAKKQHIAQPYVLSLSNIKIISLIDLTEIIQKQIELAEKEKQFRAMVEQPFTGAYVRSADRFIYVNPRFCEIVGWDQDELLTKSISDLSENYPDLGQVLSDKWKEYENSTAPQSHIVHIKRKDNKVIILGINVTPIVWNNKPAVFSMVQDITEIEEGKERIIRYISQLESAINGTFLAVSNMVEMRDPYTAGHERRVGLIAKAVSKEMGWSEEQCKVMELIGLVHDVGKISIPAEILSKPTRLTDIERQLVKGHAQAGYDILKGINFNAPVAETILQHHERLDGSGYPNGPKADQIRPEAKVLAVADVLEAMSSHRPYRPALGIDAAIDELIHGRGIIYDAEVVDATLKLIREKNYKLPT